MSIWQACHGLSQCRTISGTLYRLVESQEQVATTHLVDDLAEQSLLEDMLEDSKPPYPDKAQHLHYLLTTPFRYPPLRYGSRFGHTYEPSLFYGGLDTQTTLAEAAYYRFVYRASMDGPPPKEHLTGQHTLFTADYRTERGIQLQHTPFNDYRETLTSRSQYSSTQTLGQEMREAHILGFEYESARYNGGTNVALFEPSCFASTQPTSMMAVVSRTGSDKAEFRNIVSGQVTSFQRSDFLQDGHLPLPA